MNAGSSNIIITGLLNYPVDSRLSTNYRHFTPFFFNKELRYQLEWLDIIGLDKERMLFVPKETTLEVADLRILPTLYKPFDFSPCSSFISLIRDLVFSSKILGKNDAPRIKRLYISRSDSRKPRGIHSENMLETYLNERGYTSVKMADFTVSQQISIIASADSIITAHGAGLTNIMFAKPTCNIVEINNENYINNCFSRIWEAMEQSTGSYSHLVCKDYENNKIQGDDSPGYHLSKCVVNYSELIGLASP